MGIIASRIYLFSRRYISQEKFFLRFHLLVASFVASMVLLILRPNLISLLLGWDGLGVTSYLLVVYFQRRKSYNAGMVTALRNRVGDVLILLAIAIISRNARWNFIPIALRGQSFLLSLLLLIIIAACTKRAQIPFSAWLPAAIAAPTPVSRLVHSSTLVTAGVYLLFRFSPALCLCSAKFLILIIGALTIVIAGLAALREIDIKKIIALSTLRQLGVIIITLGVGAYLTSYFHIVSHAFFKALLFITIGAIIHIANDYQDLRKTRIFPKLSPLTLAFRLGANLSLCGLPFLRGFYSKDLCIELEVRGRFRMPLTIIFYIATALTAAYTARLIFLILWSSEKSPSLNWSRDKDPYINSSIIGLYFFSINGRRMLMWSFYFSPIHPPLAYSFKFLVLTVIIFGAIFGCSFFFASKLSWVSLSYFQIWALPYITTQILISISLLMGNKNRRLGDLFWTPTLTSDRITIGSLVKYPELATRQFPNYFQAFSFLLILMMWILLYLHVINFFIFSKVKT